MHDYIITAMVTALRPALRNEVKAQRILEKFWTGKMALVWDTGDVHTAANESEMLLASWVPSIGPMNSEIMTTWFHRVE